MLRLRLAAPKDGLRWSDPEQWHITLRFFGDVDERAIPQLMDAVRRLRTSPLQLRIQELGTFAVKGILFAAVENSPELADLQAQVESTAGLCGFVPETRPFHPHITLARSRSRSGLTTLRKMTSPEMPSFGPKVSWNANGLWLYESDLQAGGARYRTLAEVEFPSELIPPTKPDADAAQG